MAETDFFLSEYASKSAEAETISSQKKAAIQARNQIDAVEQKYCLVRERIAPYFDQVSSSDIGAAHTAAVKFFKAHNASCKEKQNFFVRLFWTVLSEKRILERNNAAEKYRELSSQYGLSMVPEDANDSDFQTIIAEALELDNAIKIALEYKAALAALKKQVPIELLDKKIVDNKNALAKIASNLWSKWLSSQTITFSPSERQEMSSFVSAMKLAGDVDLAQFPELKKQFARMSKEMTKYLQCWAVTSLSAKSRVPFQAGLFDYVIIDEASQCDIASIIPLLYRAKRAVIIGDIFRSFLRNKILPCSRNTMSIQLGHIPPTLYMHSLKAKLDLSI